MSFDNQQVDNKECSKKILNDVYKTELKLALNNRLIQIFLEYSEIIVSSKDL